MLIKLLSILVIMPMIVSDFRYRYISLHWLIAFTLTALYLRCCACELYPALLNIGVNVLITLFMLLGTGLYFRIRYGGWGIRFRDCIGTGDLLFLFSITLLFEPETFLSFLVISLLFSLAWHYISVRISGRDKTIPLVATIGVCYLVYSLIENTLWSINQ